MARKPRYLAQISALVQPAVHRRLTAIAETNSISLGEVIREALDEGLASVERRYAQATEDAPS